MENEIEHRAGVFIGPKFGILSRQDQKQGAHGEADANFDEVI